MQRLKDMYSSYYTSFLKQGKLPMRDTSLGFWSATITDELEELFRHLSDEQGTPPRIHSQARECGSTTSGRCSSKKSFIDLGSGDGKVVLAAALHGFNASGIECDKELVELSNKFKQELKLDVTFIYDDFFKHDISQYDYVFINPDKPLSRGVEEKIVKELKGTLIVYSDVFFPTKLKEMRRIKGTRFRLYSF